MAWAEAVRWILVLWSAAVGQGGGPDPEATRDEVSEVLSDPAYDYSPSLLDRIGDWISDRLDDLFPDTAPGVGGGTFAGGVGSLVAWVMIALAVAAVVAVVVVAVRNRVRKASVEEPLSASEVEHRRMAADWADEAERLEAAGEWKEALRARYRALVRTLTDRRQLPDIAGRTTGELRGDLARTTPDATGDFDDASLLFELAWYADVATGADENARFRSLAERVLDALPTDRIDPAAVFAADLGSVEVVR